MNNNQYNPYNSYSVLDNNDNQYGAMNRMPATSTSPNQGNATKNTQQTMDKDTNKYSTGQSSMDQNSNMTSSDNMNFTPFMNKNPNMQNLQKLMGQNKNYPQIQDINAIFNELLKGDITKIPFIPNPYYMINMKQNSDANTQTGRQHNQMYGYNNRPHYNPYPYTYPNQHHNPNYNMYPDHYYDHNYDHDHDYDYYDNHNYNHHNNGVNPLTWWLLASMFREY